MSIGQKQYHYREANSVLAIICVQDGDVTVTVQTGPKVGKYVVPLAFKLFLKYRIMCSIHS